MKIIADENIPLLHELLSHCSDVHFIPGRQIKHDNVKDADVLLVRSITRVDEHLLAGTRVKFVGTATAGTDHIDRNWLTRQGITWVDTPGCNAEAVAEYVVYCIAYLRTQGMLTHQQPRVGVVGVGHVGKRVVQKLQALGFAVLQNDPPRAKIDQHFVSTPLSAFTDLDLICLHVPLIKQGEFPSYHLIDKDFLLRQKPNCILLNAGRGSVVNFQDLFAHGKHLRWCFDVWENEPHINPEILKKTLLATPHIAGYSKEAKLHSSHQLARAIKKMLKLPIDLNQIPASKFPFTTSATSWEQTLLSIYNPATDTAHMKKELLEHENDLAIQFDGLRKHYHWRHEFKSIILANNQNLPPADLVLLRNLGIDMR